MKKWKPTTSTEIGAVERIARGVKPLVMRMDLLRIIRDNLSVPRDRLGRLDFSAYGPEAERGRAAREELRQLAVLLDVGGCRDTAEQIAKVITKVLEKE